MSERTIEPTRLKQGQHIEWTRVFSDFPASAYTLEYRFAGPGTRFVVTCTANGDQFVASLTVGANQAVGKYLCEAWLTKIADSSITFPLEQASGYLTIELGLTHAGTGVVETRSVAKQILDTLDAAILAAGANDVVKYETSTPAGTKLVQRSKNEALALRKEYAGIVAREDAAERARRTGKFGRSVNLRVFDNN